MYLHGNSLGRLPLSSALSLLKIPSPNHGLAASVSFYPHPHSTRMVGCPYVLTAQKAKQHIKADCALVALNQVIFCSKLLPVEREKQDKEARKKQQGGENIVMTSNAPRKTHWRGSTKKCFYLSKSNQQLIKLLNI